MKAQEKGACKEKRIENKLKPRIIDTLKNLSGEQRKKEANKPLYLVRYE